MTKLVAMTKVDEDTIVFVVKAGETYVIEAEGEVVVEKVKTYTFNISNVDPFGGDYGSVTPGTKTPNISSDGSYYENVTGATLTTNVVVSKDTEVSFIISVVRKNGVTTNDELFISILLNGSDVGVTRIDGDIACGTSWATSSADSTVVATLSLKEGVNTISFTIGDLNYNIVGIAFESSVPVTLGSTE